VSEPNVGAAPITWGVSELRGWGHQMSRDRVLDEMRKLGFKATEAGPPGYLPDGPEVRRDLLRRHGLRLVAGFLAVVLHDPAAGGLAQVEREARALAASGAEMIVLAAALPEADYDGRQTLDEEGWRRLAEALVGAHRIAAACGMTVTLHPHIGTAVQTADDVERLLTGTRANLCLDTGHLALGGADPVELAALAAARIKHVHLKDVDLGVAREFQAGRISYRDAVRRGVFRPLGQGDLDIEGVVDRLQRAGYRGWFVLEQDTALTAEPDPNSGPMVAASQSLAFFRRISGAKVDIKVSEELR
jgi:inosose dehydratase